MRHFRNMIQFTGYRVNKSYVRILNFYKALVFEPACPLRERDKLHLKINLSKSNAVLIKKFLLQDKYNSNKIK